MENIPHCDARFSHHRIHPLPASQTQKLKVIQGLTAKAINRLEDRCDHEIRHRADE